VAVQGEGVDQGRIGQVLAATAVAVFVAGLRRLGFTRAVRWFCGATLAFGSVLWAATAIGTTWFFAQVVVVLASAVIVWELAGGARPLVLGAAVTAAWLTRLNFLPVAAVLAALIWRRHGTLWSVNTYLSLNLLGLATYMMYNYLRFGNPLESGYRLLAYATVNAQDLARWGFFNVHFIPEHLYTLFIRAPELLDTPPYLKPSPWGMSVLFTSPVALRLLFPRANVRTWLPWAALVAVLALPMLAFFSQGWVQFGYRYSLDWWVFLLVLLAYALDSRPQPVDYALLALSISMNALGAYWVRALGW
jgi:hypothetical protein